MAGTHRDCQFVRFFFFNDTATTEIYTLSLHDALPIYAISHAPVGVRQGLLWRNGLQGCQRGLAKWSAGRDRKSTRLNSSHLVISYAVFCLKKKKGPQHGHARQDDQYNTVLTRLRHTSR